MPDWISAGLWALFGASSLLLGAGLAWVVDLGQKVTAAIMAFGCGVLLSAVAYDLVEDGFDQGGLWPIVLGALAGSALYTLADWAVSSRGGVRPRGKGRAEDSGLVIALGALIDGIPESVVLGTGLVAGGGVSLPILAAIFLSNFPEGLSSASGLKAEGRGPAYVFGLWTAIVAASGLAAALGAGLLDTATPEVLATVNAVAAGGLLTMIVNTMIPEAVEGDHKATGLLVVLGLLTAFALTKSQG